MEFFLPSNYDLVFTSGVPSILDASYTINLNTDVNFLNQIFLFHIDPDISTNADISDFRFSLHAKQWNPSYETNKTERKYIIENLLLDLFGFTGDETISNLDIFSNEEQLDNDISNLFTSKLKDSQIANLLAGPNGAFNIDLGLLFISDASLNDASTNDPNALTKLLLEQAKFYEDLDPSSGVLSRQFSDISNNSNNLYFLAEGWRTFQFVDSDILNFNVTVKQSPSLFPQWAFNQQALIDGGTPTTYRFRLTCRDISNLVPPLAIFKEVVGNLEDSIQPGLVRARYEDLVKNTGGGNVNRKGSTYLKYRDNNGVDGTTDWIDLAVNFNINDPFSYINWVQTYLATPAGDQGGAPTIVDNATFSNVDNPSSNETFITLRWTGYFFSDISATYFFSVSVENHVHILFKINDVWTIGVFVQQATATSGPAEKENPFWTGIVDGYVVQPAPAQINLQNGIFLPQGYTEMMILYGENDGPEFLNFGMYGGNLGFTTLADLLFFGSTNLNNIAKTNSVDTDTTIINTGLLRDINDIAYSPTLNRLVAVGNRRQNDIVIYSDDLGLTWNSGLPDTGQTFAKWLKNANTFRCVWTGTRFIATTGNATIRVISSLDGITWSDTNFNTTGVTDVYNVANNGDDYIITTTTGGNVVFYNSTLDTYTVTNVGVTNMFAAEYINNIYIVGGLDNVIYSSDGVNWLQCSAIFATNILGQTNDIAFGNGNWFITNDAYDIVTTTASNFPNLWDVIQSDNSFFAGSETPNRITYVQGTNTFYVSINHTTSIYIKSTDDGQTWQSIGDQTFGFCVDVIELGSTQGYIYVSDLSNVLFYSVIQRFNILNGYNDSNPPPT